MRKYILNSAKDKKHLSFTKIMDKLVNASKTDDIDNQLEFLKKQFGEDSDIYQEVFKTLMKK